MEKKLQSAKIIINKIKKKLGDATADWTIQVSLNSADPGRVSYACMIHAPIQGVEPLTWVCDTWEELIEKLKLASQELNTDLVEVAWHQSEINRCERLGKYHAEKIAEIMGTES